MQKKGYNYLIGKVEKLPNTYNIDRRIDPDICGCVELYDDFVEAFFGDNECNLNHGIHNANNVKQQFGRKPAFYTIFINDKEHLLSTDYIGPSIYWAREKGISDNDIIDFLSVCRTIGGHMAWPRGKDILVKINSARGGEKGVYDRIDWTLVLLKIYYETIDQGVNCFLQKAKELLPNEYREEVDNVIRLENMYGAFNCAKSWLKLFGSFPAFCKQFKLVGEECGFVTDNFDVREMAPWYPFLPENYSVYISNICDAVNFRNDVIYNP